MKMRTRLICLALACALLVGCSGDYISEEMDRVWEKLEEESLEYVAYEDMQYTRPDMAELQQLLDDAIAASEKVNLARIMDGIYRFYDGYDNFYTNYSLADIHYCADLTDTYWQEEYEFCMENSAAVDAALEELYYALAKSPVREKLEGEEYFGAGYFDAFEGENNWDEEFTALMEKESLLQMEYYALSEEAIAYEYGTDAYYEACGEKMVEVLLELIRLRQEIAASWGYTDYVQFASDFYYYRDYTPAQSAQYLQQIRTELVPLYREHANSEKWYAADEFCTEEQTYGYVRTMAENMCGRVQDAFTVMDKAGLYDIAYSENKYNSSFEVYLTSYGEPFVFLCPQLGIQDKLTFAHEFGHFCNDYTSGGSYAGIDVAEVFSQGMEYLSLCYGEGGEDLTWLKMADCLSLFVEQAAFATFEQEMYGLTGDELTVENLRALYKEVALEFGFDTVGYVDWEFVTVNHYYTNPMYIISYVVSNDAALQLYQMEQDDPGAGLECFQKNLDTEYAYFLEFLDAAGLESPFEKGRLKTVRKTLEDSLK